VKQRSGLYPRTDVDTVGSRLVSQAGGTVLVDTIRVSGLDRALGQALSGWCRPNAVHHPAKVLCDLAVALALGVDCLADVALLRAEPDVFGRSARTRRSHARLTPSPRTPTGCWPRSTPRVLLPGRTCRDWPGGTLPTTTRAPRVPGNRRRRDVGDRAQRQGAGSCDLQARVWFHPLCAFVDHGPDGTGEPLAVTLRAGTPAPTPLPTTSPWSGWRSNSCPGIGAGRRPGRKVLVRSDAAGATHAFLD
jgi:Transposase DDE domain group 1